jgi:hypothetical protein
MAMNPMELGTKDRCARGDQQRFSISQSVSQSVSHSVAMSIHLQTLENSTEL